MSAAGVKYGEEFRPVMQSDNIKFVEYRLASNSKIPFETMSGGKKRVYVVIDKNNGNLKSILSYDKDGLLVRQVDLDHAHNGQKPHTHIWDGTTKVDGTLTATDRNLIERVERLWKAK
jgi:hypothetical protein